MKQLGEVRKNAREVIRVVENEYKGHRFIDVRIYYEDEESGEYKPSKKGIALNAEVIKPVIEFLKEGAKVLKNGSAVEAS